MAEDKSPGIEYENARVQKLSEKNMGKHVKMA